jgi:hypothetical protein
VFDNYFVRTTTGNDYEEIVQSFLDDRTYMHLTSTLEMTANIFLKRGTLYSPSKGVIQDYWRGSSPEFHARESDEFTGAVFLRVDNESEMCTVNEKTLESFLSKMGGLATSLLFPFGLIAGFFVKHFYLLTLISQLYFYNEHLENKDLNEEADEDGNKKSILLR